MNISYLSNPVNDASTSEVEERDAAMVEFNERVDSEEELAESLLSSD